MNLHANAALSLNKRRGIERGAGHRVTGKRRGNPDKTDAAGRRRRQVGWEFVHIAIDDCTRLAYAEVLANEKASTVVAFLGRAIAFYERHGMTVQQLLTDGCCSYVKQSSQFAEMVRVFPTAQIGALVASLKDRSND